MVLLGAKFASVMRPQKKHFLVVIQLMPSVGDTEIFVYNKIVVGSVTAYNEHRVIICKKL